MMTDTRYSGTKCNTDVSKSLSRPESSLLSVRRVRFLGILGPAARRSTSQAFGSQPRHDFPISACTRKRIRRGCRKAARVINSPSSPSRRRRLPLFADHHRPRAGPRNTSPPGKDDSRKSGCGMAGHTFTRSHLSGEDRPVTLPMTLNP